MSLLPQLKKLRKPMYGMSLIIGVMGIMLSWVLVLIFYSAIDGLESTLKDQIDAGANTFLQVEQTVSSVGNELDATNKTLSNFETSLISLKSSLNGAGDAASDLGSGLKLINLGPISLGSYGDKFVTVGTDLKSSATSLDATAKTFKEHKTNLGDTKTKILGISDGLKTQRTKFSSVKETVVNLFSSIKLGILLLVILMDGAFLMLGINSIAGLLE